MGAVTGRRRRAVLSALLHLDSRAEGRTIVVHEGGQSAGGETAARAWAKRAGVRALADAKASSVRGGDSALSNFEMLTWSLRSWGALNGRPIAWRCSSDRR